MMHAIFDSVDEFDCTDVEYSAAPVAVMARVPADEERGLQVQAYSEIAAAAGVSEQSLNFIPRADFYDTAKQAYAVVQTNDCRPYANCIVIKGVLNPKVP